MIQENDTAISGTDARLTIEQIKAIAAKNIDSEYPSETFIPFIHQGDFPANADPLAFSPLSTKFREFGDLDLSFLRPPDIPFPAFPSWIGDHVRQVAQNKMVPDVFPGMLALSVMAVAVQGKFVVERNKGHREQLSLWTVAILPPGSIKSGTYEAMIEPLNSWSAERNDNNRQDIEERKAHQKIAKKQIEAKLNLVGKDGEASDEDLAKEIATLQEVVDKPINEIQLLSNDATAETTQNLLVEQSGKIGFLSDEPGIFETLAGLYSGGKANFDIFLKGYTGSSATVDRMGRKCHIPSPHISFGLCAQPDALKGISTDTAKKSFQGRGLIGRFLWVFPESNIGSRDIDSQGDISETVSARYSGGIKKLLSIIPDRPDTTDGGKPQPFVITVSTKASTEYRRFWMEIEKQQGAGGRLLPIQDWTSKRQGDVLRIAALLHLAWAVEQSEKGTKSLIELAKQPISLAEMRMATYIVGCLISHTLETYSLMGACKGVRSAHAVACYDWIKENGALSVRETDMRNACSKTKKMTADQFAIVLSTLEQADVIGERIEQATNGRPAFIRMVNPQILNSPENGG